MRREGLTRRRVLKGAGAPRVIKGRVVIGQGGAEYGVRGFLAGYDADTGTAAGPCVKATHTATFIALKPGLLTRSDKSLARFLKYLREYPRAHPSADFIN